MAPEPLLRGQVERTVPARGMSAEAGRSLWTVVLVFGLTLVAYFPALRGDFIWNDSDYVTAPALRSLHGLARIWFQVGATQQYYPVLHSAFWVEHRLWGDAAMGYHLANILLHATAACLVARLFGRIPALLFALHPVCVESVAWISEQKNTLSLVFYLLAALAYLRFDRERGWGNYAAGLALFALAVLSKSVTATLPAALLVLLWWKQGRLSLRQDWLPLAPWLAVGAAGGLFTAWVERHYLGAQGTAFNLDGVQRCLVAGRIIWFYAVKLVWPAPLNFNYARWSIRAGDASQYLFLVAAIGMTIAFWLFRKRSRAPLAAWLFFVGSLFPTLGFFNVYAFIFSYVADHWQYLACLGLLVPVGVWLEQSSRSGAPPLSENQTPASAVAARASIAVILCAFGFLTWRQCAVYRDSETLYRTILAGNPDAWMAHNNLGNILREQNRPADAEPHFERAIALEPEFLPARNNLGNARFQLGQLAGAREAFLAALQVDPNSADAHSGLGGVLFQMHRPAEGLFELAEATRCDPNSPKAHYNYAIALDQSGRIPEAAQQFEWVLRLRPDSAEAHNNYGNVLSQLGRRAEARTEYETALRIDPAYTDAKDNLSHLQ